MLPNEDRVRLRQMLDHCREAVALVAGRSLESVAADRVLGLALVRLLEVVGEAAGRVSPETRARNRSIPWPQTVSMRNRLIHGYDSVDMGIVWQVIQHDLPPVIGQLERLLSPEGDEPVDS